MIWVSLNIGKMIPIASGYQMLGFRLSGPMFRRKLFYPGLSKKTTAPKKRRTWQDMV